MQAAIPGCLKTRRRLGRGFLRRSSHKARLQSECERNEADQSTFKPECSEDRRSRPLDRATASSPEQEMRIGTNANPVAAIRTIASTG